MCPSVVFCDKKLGFEQLLTKRPLLGILNWIVIFHHEPLLFNSVLALNLFLTGISRFQDVDFIACHFQAIFDPALPILQTTIKNQPDPAPVENPLYECVTQSYMHRAHYILQALQMGGLKEFSSSELLFCCSFRNQQSLKSKLENCRFWPTAPVVKLPVKSEAMCNSLDFSCLIQGFGMDPVGV